jgi:hypothetical protein
MEQWNEFMKQLNLNDETQSVAMIQVESGPTRGN